MSTAKSHNHLIIIIIILKKGTKLNIPCIHPFIQGEIERVSEENKWLHLSVN